MRWRPTETVAALLAAVLLAGPVHAAAAPPPRALLIGVGDYPNLPERLRLQAPGRDVARMKAALINAGLPESDITIMTEHAGVRPTRAGVLEALGALAATARPGEAVLVYFSGHGAQAPARRPEREPDGLEELYLAADAARWDGAVQAVPGSIADFEMEAALEAIRARGAEVWFVADACHAAGLTRGAGGAGGRTKTVSATDLGVPGPAFPRGLRVQDAPLEGGFTGFYAAGPGALAEEALLPAGAPDAEPASVFTFALTRALGQGRYRTFRDLAVSVAAAQVEAAGAAPMFEGDLGASVLGLKADARSFRVDRRDGRLTAAAGSAEGFEPGVAIDLLRLSDGAPAGRARVARSGLATSELEPLGPLADTPVTARVAARARLSLSPRPGDALLQAVAPLSGRAGAGGIRVEGRVWRGGCGDNPPAALGFPAGARPVEMLSSPALAHCDVLYLRLVNATDAPLDVSPLYVSADGTIAGLTWTPDDDVRLPAGAIRFAAVRILTRDAHGRPLPTGVEHFVLVAAKAGAGRLDLRGLASPSAVRGAAPRLDEDVGALVFPLRVEG